MSDENKTYLGDGVYADCDGFQVELTCDCMSKPNTIYLEPNVMERLIEFYKRVRGKDESAS